MFKKFLSTLLAVVIVTSTFTSMTVSATEDNTANITNDDVSVQGENSFGNLLTEEIEGAMAQETTSADFAITGLKVDEQTATVEYMSAIDCTILVALYDEATNQMVASGKSVVSNEEDVASITIEADAMPQYFIATAYMLDSNNAPLTEEFTTELYTEEIQMVKAMKATDFEEDRVLNLDDSDDTNFAVYSEDTKVLEYKENYNIPVTVDDENGIYVFSNADDDLKTLVKGDMFAYEYSLDNIIILKVDTITIDGDTVTITEGDAELEDVFDYVKIEATQDEGEFEVNMDDIDDGIQLVEDTSSVSSKTPSSVGAIDTEVNYFHEASFKFLDVSCIFGEIKFSVTSTLELYISLDKADIDFTVEYALVGSVGLEATTEEIEVPFAEIKIPVGPGVVLTVVPAVVFEAKASASLEIEIKGTAGFKATKKEIKVKDLSLAADSSPKVQGEVFFGVQFEPSLDILDKDIASAGLPITAGVRFQAQNKKYDADHLCLICFEGEATKELYVSSELKLSKKRVVSEKKGIKDKLFDFYFSTDFLDVGKGKCPHSKHTIDIYVTKDGKPYQSAEVWLYKDTYAEMVGTTDSNGKLTVTLSYGLYTADVDGELVSFLAYKDTEKVEIKIGEKTEPVTTEPATVVVQPTNPKETEPETTISNVLASGVCGDNITWELLRSGELNIIGNGDMYDYTAGTAPWYGYLDSITAVNLNGNITSIGSYTFYRVLTDEIILPSTVVSIGEGAFMDCLTLRSANIPQAVTTIGDNAYSGCGLLAVAELPSGITEIPDGLFKNCVSLSEITIPKGVTVIGANAFDSCWALESVYIPSTMVSIGDYAFSSCESLKSVIITQNVEYIGCGAFADCTALNTVYFNAYNCANMGDEENLVFDGCNSLTTVVFGNSVEVIPDYAFCDCTGINRVDMSDSITSIGFYSFLNCTGLTKIAIPKYVESLPSSAFGGCTNLNTVDYYPTIRTNLFSLTSIKTVNFYNDIPKWLLDGCAHITEVNINDGVTSIGYGAFRGCENIKDFNVPESVEKIEELAFHNTGWYNSQPEGLLYISDILYGYTGTLTDVEVKQGTRMIADRALSNCATLESVYIPSGVVVIGDNAFSECRLLSKVTLPPTLKKIGEGCFSWCESLSKSSIPASVKSIGRSAFSQCYNLSEVNLPDGLVRLEESMFEGCGSLKNISLPPNLTYIGNAAFCCSGLESIELPEKLESIGNEAFRDTKLTSIKIPDSVITIGSKEVTSLHHSGRVFAGCERLVKVDLGDKITYITTYAFSGCISLESVEIPSSVTYICEEAFGACESLKTVNIPESVSYIDYGAFSGCGNLKYVCIYGNPRIANYAFPDETKIYYLSVGETVPTEEWTEPTTESWTEGWTEATTEYWTEAVTESTTEAIVEAVSSTIAIISSVYVPTARFDNLIAGEDYIVAVVKSEDVDDLLSANNLLYIDQITADENGSVSLEYVPRESVENFVALIFGAERMSISDAQIVVLKDEGTQAVEYTVSLNGTVLTENTDYELTSDGNSVTITGINSYKESLTLTVEPMLIGDVNKDNEININDTTLIMKYIVELENFDDNQKLVADTNGDGVVSVTDATQIQKYLAQMIATFK